MCIVRFLWVLPRFFHFNVFHLLTHIFVIAKSIIISTLYMQLLPTSFTNRLNPLALCFYLYIWLFISVSNRTTYVFSRHNYAQCICLIAIALRITITRIHCYFCLPQIAAFSSHPVLISFIFLHPFFSPLPASVSSSCLSV